MCRVVSDGGVDAGPIPFDAGPIPFDAGFDAGPIPFDAGFDAGPIPFDAGFDAGPIPFDGGFDAGPISFDGGFDAGVDAGPPPDGSGAISVPRTGQTISYAPGDDGDLERGVAWPSPRFVDHGDGTVTDNLTGLMWLRDVNCMAAEYPEFDQLVIEGDGAVEWQRALDFVRGIDTGIYAACGAGHTDWRLPNARELRSLVDYSRFSHSLPSGHPFVSTGSVWGFWTSTSVAGNPLLAFTVNMTQEGPMYGITKPTAYGVWPVRTANAGAPARVAQTGQSTCYDANGVAISCAGTGQDGDLRAGVAWPSPRFTFGTGAEEGCVTDRLTGLMWTRAPETATTIWTTALTTANGASRCGHDDWRLPNIAEVETLVHYGQGNTASWLTTQGFTNVTPGDYWSSTTTVCITGCTGWAWIAGTWQGGVGPAPKGETLHTWLVR